jgi:arsenate reductase
MQIRPTKDIALLPSLGNTVRQLLSEFDNISASRKGILKQLAEFIHQRAREEVDALNFICTHNSRRSQMAQLWAQAAAYYYDIPNVQAFSGGTESTCFNFQAVSQMQRAGFEITIIKAGDNPIYEVRYSNNAPAVTAFSKKYDDIFNPRNFAAIMTCSHADENCPLIPQALTRIVLAYDDPKEFDGTTIEPAKYYERAREIGREMLFAFSEVRR